MKYPLLVWKCSVCGADTHVNPPTEPEFEEQEVEVQVPETKMEPMEQTDPDTGEKRIVNAAYSVMTTQKVKRTVQKVAKLKRQNMFSGAMEEIHVPAYRDLFPRTIQFQLKLGSEQIQFNFCPDCFSKHKTKMTEFWNYVEKIPCP